MPGIIEPVPVPGIITQTAKGNPIPNAPMHEISEVDRNKNFVHLERKYGKTFRMRTASTPRYNCHGMTFASRRTAICDEGDLRLILSDDNYEELKNNEALPGDIIVYFDAKGEIEHTGIVLTEPQLEVSGFPDVFSKWGKYHELIHAANNCPYNWGNIKYFRIRKC
jgi:hypothetical protein